MHNVCVRKVKQFAREEKIKKVIYQLRVGLYSEKQ